MKPAPHIAVVLASVAALLVTGCAPQSFELAGRTIDPKGEVTAVFPAAFRPEGRKWLAVTAAGGLTVYDALGGSKPKAEVRLEPGTVFVGAADVDGVPGDELVAVSGGRVRYLKWRASGFAPHWVDLLEIDTGFRGPVEKVVSPDFLRDIDGDGTADLVLPASTAGGAACVAVYRQAAPGRFAEFGRLAAGARGSFASTAANVGSETTYSYSVLMPHFIDTDGDGRREALLVVDDRLLVFRPRRDGTYPSKADAEVRLVVGSEAPGVPPSVSVSSAQFAPLARRRPGLALTDLGGRRALVFDLTDVGGSDRTSLDPAGAVAVAGFVLGSRFLDITGNGRAELALVTVPPQGLLSVLRLYFSRSLDAYVRFYRSEGGWKEYQERRISYPLTIGADESGVAFGLPAVLNFRGDLTGDGVNDMLMSVGPDRLALYVGSKNGGFDSARASEVEVPSALNYRGIRNFAVDLDGDGRDEVVLTYLGWNPADNRVVVIGTTIEDAADED